MKQIGIKIINQLKDNYSFILYDSVGNASIVDPAESFPIVQYVENNCLKINDIFITHHHKDHTSGIQGIVRNFPNVNVHSPSSYIENTRFVLSNNDEIETQINSFKIISTPGHTMDHIIYFDYNNKILFSGDTLFRLGCGRIFEGTLNQMYLSLQKINELDDPVVYCGHEYTTSNLNFLEYVTNKKKMYSEMRQMVEDDLKTKNRTVPFNLAEERSYNLFLNQESEIGDLMKKELKLENFALFKHLREKKDIF